MLRPSMSISRFWHYQQLMLQLQMAIWKLAPSIYVLPMDGDMVVSSQVYIYLLRFIDPSCNPHLSLMSMYRRTLTSLNWRWPYMAQVNSSRVTHQQQQQDQQSMVTSSTAKSSHCPECHQVVYDKHPVPSVQIIPDAIRQASLFPV